MGIMHLSLMGVRRFVPLSYLVFQYSFLIMPNCFKYLVKIKIKGRSNSEPFLNFIAIMLNVLINGGVTCHSISGEKPLWHLKS